MNEREPLLPSNGKVDGHGTNPKEQALKADEDIVTFDPNGDEENPLDWPKRYKWFIVFILASMAFTTTFTCIGVVPIAQHIVRDLDGRDRKSASVLLVTIWELGEAAGPLFIAPLSEIFGRYGVFNAANLLLILGVLLAALSPASDVLIFARFLTGCAVASNVLNPAIIGDIFPPESRGKGMSAVFVAPLLGGAIGPVIGGALAESVGWRFVLWLAFGLAIVVEIGFLTLFRETYSVVILRRRAERLRQETGSEALRTEFDAEDPGKSAALWRAIVRPANVFFSSVVLQLLSLWGAITFAFFYVMSTTLPDMLQGVYGFSSTNTGFAFLTFSMFATKMWTLSCAAHEANMIAAVGSILGIALVNLVVDRIYVKLLQRQDEAVYPEGRMPLVIAGGFTFPFFVVLCGCAAELHWPVWLLMIIVVVLGFFLCVSVIPMMTYITDAFGVYSASAMTAVLITRCLAGTFLPLATAPLTTKYGFGLGYLVIGGIMLVLAPIPAIVMRYGSRLRQRSKFTKKTTAISAVE